MLRTPLVLFQSNHVLAVHKPPGWHSIPHTDGDIAVDTSKCLLTYLCEQGLGGGSQKKYLKPLHRIDQPCSGLLLFGKTTKAASRIQSLFNKMSKSASNEDGTTALVLQKTYYVMVHHSTSSELHSTDPGAWQTLHGGVVPRTHRDIRHCHSASPQKGWSVHMVPLEDYHVPTPTGTKPHRTFLRGCSLRYRRVCTYTPSNTRGNHGIRLLEVETAQGARHLIRALLSCHGLIVVGDLRYGDTHGPLPDQSVALHARSLQFPPSFQLVKGDYSTVTHAPFPQILKAPIPMSWETYFHCTQDMINIWEAQLRCKQ